MEAPVEAVEDGGALAKRPWTVRAYERGARALSSAPARRATVLLARAALLLRALVPGRLVQRLVLAFVKMEAACCRSGSPHFKFVQRYVDRFERAGTFDRMRRFLRVRPRAQAAARLDAWVRIGVTCTMRHEILGRHLGTPGVPPRLLTEAQLALSPGCDLTCEGCYTLEDRGGAAPRRARIEQIVDEVVSCGAFAVHVIGKGEPFLSPRWAGELLDVIEARPHVFFTIATHAMHVDDALAARVGRLGNLVLLVAVEGPADVHDARRGEGAHARVMAALARLRAHGAVFGFSCMVSAKSRRAVTSPAFLREVEEAGCVVGIYSRYFPLASSAHAELALDGDGLAAYERDFERARLGAKISLVDLDEVEQHTGCHSRAGESIYVDGVTGQVAPCLRVPFAPRDCRLEEDAPRGRLAEILAHPYFTAYRDRSQACPSWCGANLERELASVGDLLARHPPAAPEPAKSARLADYATRTRTARPPRRLPLLGDAGDTGPVEKEASR